MCLLHSWLIKSRKERSRWKIRRILGSPPLILTSKLQLSLKSTWGQVGQIFFNQCKEISTWSLVGREKNVVRTSTPSKDMEKRGHHRFRDPPWGMKDWSSTLGTPDLRAALRTNSTGRQAPCKFESQCVCVRGWGWGGGCSVMSDSAIPWTAVCQAPFFMEFSRQEYWIRLPFPTLGDLPDLGTEPMCLISPALSGRFFTTAPSGKP